MGWLVVTKRSDESKDRSLTLVSLADVQGMLHRCDGWSSKSRLVESLLQNLKAESIIIVLLSGSGVVAMRGDKRAGMKIDFGGVVEALPGLVWTTQADGRSDFINRGWREYTGLGLDDAIGHGWQAAIHPDDLASFERSWDLIRQSGIATEIDARLCRFDGQYRWFVFRPSPLPEDDSSHQRWCWLGPDADESASTAGAFVACSTCCPSRPGS
jgi:PAS domain S-box-containing protein